jgi:hypothetical protein
MFLVRNWYKTMDSVLPRNNMSRTLFDIRAPRAKACGAIRQRLFVGDFQLIVDVAFAGDGNRDRFNLLLLVERLHRPA